VSQLDRSQLCPAPENQDHNCGQLGSGTYKNAVAPRSVPVCAGLIQHGHPFRQINEQPGLGGASKNSMVAGAGTIKLPPSAQLNTPVPQPSAHLDMRLDNLVTGSARVGLLTVPAWWLDQGRTQC
jgi:hypothetical protein